MDKKQKSVMVQRSKNSTGFPFGRILYDRAVLYITHRTTPLTSQDPLRLFPETPELCTKIFFQKYLQKPLAISEKICYYIQVTWMMTSIKQIGA